MSAQSSIHSHQIGTGRQHVVLLHGWGQSSANLKPLAQLLAPRFQIHSLDLPGFGKSPLPTDIWGNEEYAQSVMRFLDEKNIERAHFVGHSFGGKIALRCAHDFGDRVGKIVLMASAGLKPLPSLKKRLRSKGLGVLRTCLKTCDGLVGTQWYKNWYTPRFASRDYLNAGPMRSILVKSVNEDLSPILPQIPHKALLLWGADDQDTPLEMAERMHRDLSHSELRVFEKKGHHFCLGVGAHLCARYILPFLQEDSQ